MFMGEYTHSIDVKGRIILPADFRQELGLTFIITKGLENCLWLLGQKAWDEFAKKFSGSSVARAEKRAVERFFFSGARTLECDKQGRFLVPANLRKFAGIAIKGDVVLTGIDNRIEIWSKERWDAYMSEVEPDANAIAATLAGSGF